MMMNIIYDYEYIMINDKITVIEVSKTIAGGQERIIGPLECFSKKKHASAFSETAAERGWVMIGNQRQ